MTNYIPLIASSKFQKMQSREIKFRAWDNVDYMSTPFTLYDIQEKKVQFTHDVVIMQYTGLKDAKNRDIYEGDVYYEEIEEGEGDIRIFYVVVWIKEWCMFTLLSTGELLNYEDNGADALDTIMFHHVLDKEEFLKMHYKGNIHQQPELLKL